MSDKEKLEAGYYEEDGERMTLLWRDYQRGLDYQRASGLAANIPQYVRFFEGKQWPAATEETKNLPRPVINMIKMICRNKKAAILSSRVRLVYEAMRRNVSAEAFNRFAEYIVGEIKQEELDKQAVDDAIVKGTYVYHYYWDTEARGRSGVELGGLCGQVVDPLSVFFANPRERDEQKQKWILIALRQDVDTVRAEADDDVDPSDIVSDDATDENPYDVTEQEGDGLCTVLLRYFRRDGEVFCEKGTKSVIFKKAFPITPDFEGAMEALSAADGGTSPEGGDLEDTEGMDAPNGTAPDDTSDKGDAETLRPKGARAYLYPVVVGSYEKREGSIFGIGEVEGLLPNQRAVNFNLAMLLLNAQTTAWGKFVVDPGTLRDQVISNEPGEVIVDYSGTGNGIRVLNTAGASSQPLQLVETIMQLSRSVTGSTEVMTGEMLGANMSGAAIAQLQSQAQAPIEELRDSFWLVKEKQGRVLAQFFKLYYRDAEYSYEEEPSPAPQAAPPLPGGEAMMLGGAMPEQASGGKQMVQARFTGADYADVEFDVTCEAMSGTKFSAAGDINVLDVLYAKGAISLETYIEAYPDDAMSNKSKLLELIRREKSDREMQLQQQLQETQAQLQQSAQLLEQQKATVDQVVSIIQENNRTKAMLGQLFAEANAKIEAANAQVEAGNARIGEVEDDARMFAEAIERMEGGAGYGMPQVQDHDAAIAS